MTATTEQTARMPAAALRTGIEGGDTPRLVDVRSPAEYETAHIEGAVNVPVDLLRGHLAQVAPAVPEGAVLVCQTGPRAEEAQRLLGGAGRPGTRVLDGGMNAWLAGQAPVRRGRETWALERQVRFTAGSLVLAGIVGGLVAPRARFLAGGIGGGLVFSAVTNTCGMGNVLSRMPWNQGAGTPSADQVVAALRS